MLKVIFLDIDGVLNSETYAKRFHEENLGEKGNHIFVDPDAVELVRKLCDENDVKIVLSSSWRSHNLKYTLVELAYYRDLAPILKYIIGITPRSVDRIRGVEIESVLGNWNLCVQNEFIDPEYTGHQNDVNYVIIDDDSDMLDDQKEHFVQTDWFVGITEDDINKVKQILKLWQK